MDDPFDAIIACCNFSSSQEDLLMHSCFAREDELFSCSDSPEPYPPPPSSSVDVADAGARIVICSAPETPSSKAAVSPSMEEFKTPPEESRRSSSEEPEPPPSQQSFCARGGELDCAGVNGGRGIPAVETDCGVLDGETPHLGFSQEGKRTPIVELLSDGKVLVGEVAKVEFDSFRVEGKRRPEKQSPIEHPSPSKRVRTSGDFSGLTTTPNVAMEEVVVMSGVKVKKATPLNWVAPGNLPTCERSGSDLGSNGTDEEGECLAKRKLEFPVEMEVKVKVETEECDGDFGNGEDDQKIDDTEEIEDYDEGEENQNCANSKDISSAQNEEKGEGNGSKETGGESLSGGNSVEDMNRQGKRELPSWIYPQENKREDVGNGKRKDEKRLNAEQTVSVKMGALLEVLALLAREEKDKRKCQPTQFLSISNPRGGSKMKKTQKGYNDCQTALLTLVLACRNTWAFSKETWKRKLWEGINC